MSETSTLIGYGGGRTIGREELTLVPTPPATGGAGPSGSRQFPARRQLRRYSGIHAPTSRGALAVHILRARPRFPETRPASAHCCIFSRRQIDSHPIHCIGSS